MQLGILHLDDSCPGRILNPAAGFDSLGRVSSKKAEIMNHHPEISNTIILITRNGMGESDTEQGLTLIKKYLTVLNDNNYLPFAICFYTAGVKLVIGESPVLDLLKLLESKGVRLFICTTCLLYYDIFEQVKIGTICGMPDIIKMQWKAEKVITL